MLHEDSRQYNQDRKTQLTIYDKALIDFMFLSYLIQSQVSHQIIYTWRNCNGTASWYNGISSHHTKQMVSYVGIQCTFGTTTIMMREIIKGLTLLSRIPILFFMVWMEVER